jgi:hypothetical protein
MVKTVETFDMLASSNLQYLSSSHLACMSFVDRLFEKNIEARFKSKEILS